MFRARNDLDIILGKRRRILGRQHRRDGSIVTVYGSCIEGMGVTYRRDRHSRQDGRESTDGGGFGRYRRESDGFP